jgi:hypothetical protein
VSGTLQKKELEDEMAGSSRANEEQGHFKDNMGDRCHREGENMIGEAKYWAMEIYKGEGTKAEVEDDDDEVLELDLEEEAEVATKFMAIAVYFSQKSYNPKILFSDMLNVWGLKELALVKNLGDYCFKLEFHSQDEKMRVLEGGPWRHKGDALIVVHYDGLCRPSEVKIDTIQLWVRLYDLPAAMMRDMWYSAWQSD